ncbi:MAG: hypothetical protein OEU26_36605, partial [Candidatus Tectomicrobia bacterium]|nr:hypothetical protein [Candidatus Tectomicrobia bacterium]
MSKNKCVPFFPEANLGQLAGRMDQLTEHMDQLTERVDSLVQNVSRLADVQHQMGIDLGRLKGSDLERRYRERAPAYFHRLIRRPHALSADELVTLIEDARFQGRFSEDEADALFQADVIVRGRRHIEGT